MRAILVYPWRCLWRGFVHSTRRTPARRMTLQFLHSGLIDALTFMCLPRSMRDATARQVERRELDRHQVTRHDAHVPHAHRPGDVCHHFMTVVQVHAEEGIGHRLGDSTPDCDDISPYVPLSPQGTLKI